MTAPHRLEGLPARPGASRRRHGAGSIFRRSNGLWVAATPRRYGKRRHFYGHSQEEVERKLHVWVGLRSGVLVRDVLTAQDVDLLLGVADMLERAPSDGRGQIHLPEFLGRRAAQRLREIVARNARR